MRMRGVKARMCVFFGLLVLLGGVVFAFETVKMSRRAIVEFLGDSASKITRNVMKGINSENVLSVISAVDAARNDEARLSLVLGMPEYIQVHEYLSFLREVVGLKYLYTMAITSDGKCRYIVDGTKIDDKENFSPPGSEVSNLDDAMQKAFATGEHAQTDIIEDSEFGSLVVSYCPMRARNGRVLYVIGGDYSADEAIAAADDLQRRIFVLVGLVLGVSLSLTYLAADLINKGLKK